MEFVQRHVVAGTNEDLVPVTILHLQMAEFRVLVLLMKMASVTKSLVQVGNTFLDLNVGMQLYNYIQ